MTSPPRRPTRRQLETLRAYIAAGSIAAAAHDLGIAEATARQHLSGLYQRTGCQNAAQAAYRLGCADIMDWRGRATIAGRTVDQSGDRWSKSRRNDVSMSLAVKSSRVP